MAVRIDLSTPTLLVLKANICPRNRLLIWPCSYQHLLRSFLLDLLMSQYHYCYRQDIVGDITEPQVRPLFYYFENGS
jgi:hypothetical protein